MSRSRRATKVSAVGGTIFAVLIILMGLFAPTAFPDIAGSASSALMTAVSSIHIEINLPPDE